MNNRFLKRTFTYQDVLFILFFCFSLGCSTRPQSTESLFLNAYPCVPFSDTKRPATPQIIPGRVQNEFYDTLPVSNEEKIKGVEENLCYHDSDKINSGSGTFNGTGTYNKEFRMYEAVDISYTKFNNGDPQVDDSPFNRFTPDANSLYIGWLNPGEWINYTVDVQESGFYTFTTVYTSKFGGHISLDLNGKDITGPIEMVSTFDAADPIDWRQAHHWNKSDSLSKFYLPKGKQVLTLHIIDKPVLNFDYMEFIKLH